MTEHAARTAFDDQFRREVIAGHLAVGISEADAAEIFDLARHAADCAAQAAVDVAGRGSSRHVQAGALHLALQFIKEQAARSIAAADALAKDKGTPRHTFETEAVL